MKREGRLFWMNGSSVRYYSRDFEKVVPWDDTAPKPLSLTIMMSAETLAEHVWLSFQILIFSPVFTFNHCFPFMDVQLSFLSS